MEGKKRRIRIHAAWSFAVAILLTLVIAVTVFQRSNLLSYQLSKYVNDHYFKDTPFRFSCGTVRSDLVSQATVSDLEIRYADDKQSVTLFSADEIAINYDIVKALRLKIVVGYLGLEKVRIALWYDEGGKPVVPVPRNLSGFSDQGVSPYVEVRRFVVHDLQFSIEKEKSPFVIKDVDVDGSARYADGRGKIQIEQGRAHVAKNDKSISSIRATVDFEGGRVNLSDAVVRLEQSLVMLSGRYENGRLHHVRGVFNPLNLDELSSLGWIPEHHGEVGGSLVVEGTRDSLAVEGSLTGRALSLVFTGLQLKGVVTPERVDLSSVEGQIHGSRVKGSVAYDRRTGGYTLRGNCEKLDLTQGFLPESGAPQTDLNGSVRLDFDNGTKAYDVRADLRNSAIAGFEGEEIQFAGGWNAKRGLDVRAFTLTRPGFALAGFGSINAKNEADFVLSVGGNQLDYATDYLQLPRLGGSADLTAKLVGPIDRLQINVNGSWRDLTYLTARVDSGQVHADARDVRSPRAHATVDVQGRRLYYRGREFSAPHLLFDVSSTNAAVNTAVRDFTFSKGDTLVTMDFDTETRGAQTSILLKHVAVQTPQMTWRNQNHARVIVREESTAIDSLVLSANGYEIGASGCYSTDPSSNDLHFWGENVDMALLRGASSASAFLTGVGRFEATIRGDPENPDVRVSLVVARGTLQDLSFDRLSLNGEYADSAYRVDRLCIEQGSDSLVASGWWKHAQSPVAVAKSGLNGSEAWNADIFVEARGERFPITGVIHKARAGLGWQGAFTGRATMSNTLADPRIEVLGSVSMVSESGIVVPEIRGGILYEDGHLNVRSLSADDGTNRAEVTGDVPLEFDVRKGFAFSRRAPVGFSADLAVKDLSVVARHIDAIAAATGALTGRIEVRGSADEPQFNGNLEVRGAAMRLATSDEIFRDINADISVRDNRVTLTSLSARKSKKGSVSARGTATIKGFGVTNYSADVTLNDLPLSMIPGFQSVQSGKVRVESRQEEQGRSVPYVSGSLDVKEAVITRSLAAQEGPPSPLTMPEDRPSWFCNLDLHAPKNVWVRNPEFNFEMGGDLVLKRDKAGLYLRGDLSVLRGSYTLTLYNNKFRITDGRFDFATATTLRPGIYLDAYTPYRRAGEAEQKIFLSLSWPADEKEPKITLSYSEPGYSEADVWAMLGGQVVSGRGLGEGESWKASETATTLASGLAYGYLERILNAQMSNDMTIAVESRPVGESTRTGTQESEVSIAVGRYLSEDLYLNYRQGLRVTSARQVDVEYRLSNMLLLRSEIIQYSQKGIEGKSRQTTDEINFDIKFRWEY